MRQRHGVPRRRRRGARRLLPPLSRCRPPRSGITPTTTNGRDLTDAGRRRPPRLAGRCGGAVERRRGEATLTPRRGDRPAHPAREPGRHALRRGDARRGVVEPDDLRLPVRQRPLQPAGPRVRARCRSGCAVRRLACAALPAALDQARATAAMPAAHGRSAASTPRRRSERMPGLLDLVDTAVEEASDAGRRGAARRRWRLPPDRRATR